MNYKLGFGPMSHMIVDILADYANANQKPIMIIASRNQVDADSGYVMSTRELSDKIRFKREYLLLCRDHCGPYFLDSEKHLSQRQAIEATKKTIAMDIESGFDLLHIDTSRCDDSFKVADELFKFCLDLKSNILFEFGTEENVGLAAGITKYMEDARFASQYSNVEYVVAQTGSLTYEDRQAGTFEFDMVKGLVDIANAHNLKLKEHNADYLNADQIKLRKQAGVHACNIAPQLGVIQTTAILRLADYYAISTENYKNAVIQSEKWAKWTKSKDNDLRVKIAGHYLFNSPEYKQIETQLEQLCNVSLSVSKPIHDCLDLYFDNLY